MKNDKKDLDGIQTNKLLNAYISSIRARADLASKFGIQFGGDRDLYKSLGYKRNLDYEDFEARYRRQDIARAVIDRPVEATWRDGFSINEGKHKQRSNFEQKWDNLYEDLNLLDKFIRVDKLTSIGHYGALLLGFSDAKKQEDMIAPVKESDNLELVYVKPLGEGSIKIDEWVDNPGDKRFNMPRIYNVTIESEETGVSSNFKVHYTRIIHTVGTLLESEMFSTPVLEPIFNRLYDLEKIVGGSGEMFWRGARPGYQGKLDEDYALGDNAEEELKDQIDEFEHDLRRFIVNKGLNLEALETQVENPQKHVDVQVQMIAAERKIPKRILTGSEVGELASSQDRTSWLENIDGRRKNHAETHIIKPFIQRCIDYGVLPEYSEKYSIDWPDLWSPSDKEKAEVGNIRAKALNNYIRQISALDVIPPEAFFRFVWGLDDEEVDFIEEIKNENIDEEQRLAEEIDGENSQGDVE